MKVTKKNSSNYENLYIPEIKINNFSFAGESCLLLTV